jgi:hypothetical protein
MYVSHNQTFISTSPARRPTVRIHSALELSNVLHGNFEQLENDTHLLLATSLICKVWAIIAKVIALCHPIISALAFVLPQ